MMRGARADAARSSLFLVILLALVLSQGLLTSCGTTPTAGGVLRVAGAEPETLDPALAQDVTSRGYLLQIHSGLVRLDADLNVVPALASEWRVSDDGRTYTFIIREGARFHNGKEVTATDVKYSLERATDPALDSPSAAIYLGDIVGVADKMAGRATEVSGIVVRDERTVEITIDAPKAYFLAKLTYPTAFVLDRENVEVSERWYEQPNGTGPFRLVNVGKDWIVLERNEQYYFELPRLQQVRFYVGPRSAMAMYEAGELDVTPVNLGDIERVLDEDGDLYDELTIGPGLGLYYLGLNTRIEPFDDRAVRRAFAMAIDRQKIVDVTLKGTVELAEGIVPPPLPGHDSDVRCLPFDVEQAKRSLAESAYAGQPLPVVTLTGGMGELFAEVFWRNLGAEMEVQVVQEGYFEGLRAGLYDAYFTGWVADYPDPENFLDVLFHSGSAGNHSGYSNPEVDDLLERARVETDEAKRLALYAEAERLIVEDAPIIPLFFDREYTLVKPHVKGLVQPMPGVLDLRDVTVD